MAQTVPLLLLLSFLLPPGPAPATYKVKFETTSGDFVVEVHRDWAPMGADHFQELVAAKFFDQCRFYRVVKRFVVQWGVSGDPLVNRKWGTLTIKDDPPKQKNLKGTIAYAKEGVNNRTTMVFVNLADNPRLDSTGFAPFGKVIAGMDVVEKLFAGYGDTPPRGEGPDPTKIQMQGNSYLEGRFPRLDYIKKATIVP
jgi:peptidyl-prolyl cis-trans isomerase A (cyclophilin A)